MPASIFAGSKVKTLKGTLSLNGGADVISSTTDPTSVAVDASPGSILLNTTSGKQYRKNDSGSSTNWTEVGAGTSGINYITNPSASTNTTGWATYADAAGAQPVDGTGGSPTVTWTRSTTTPLRGAADFNFTKDAANRQGEGVATDITIDLADRAKVLTVTFDYEVLSGTYADGDLTVYLIADPTGTPVVIQPAGYTVQSATVGTTMRQTATFQTQATGQSYRVCFHVASTSAAAYVVAVDNVICGPQSTVQGAAVSDWVSYTPTIAGSPTPSGTSALNAGRWRRVGDSIELNLFLHMGSTGTAGSATSAIWGLPGGLAVDLTKLARGNSQTVGHAMFWNTVSESNLITQATATGVFVETTAGGPVQANNILANYQIAIVAFLPIQGWSSNTVMSQDTDTRVVSARYKGVPSTSITSGIPFYLDFNSKDFDTHGAWTSTGAHTSSSANGSKYTVPVAGYYKVNFHIMLNETSGAFNGTNEFFDVSLNKNGSVVSTISGRPYSVQQYPSRNGSMLVSAVAGDILQLAAIQTSGSSLAIFNSADLAFIEFERLSGPATIAASETVAMRAYKNTGSHPGGGWVDTSAYTTTSLVDSHGAFNTTTGIYTAPVSGKYQVSGTMILQANNVGSRAIRVDKVGTGVILGGNVIPAATGTTTGSVVSGICSLLAGEQIKLLVYSDSTAPTLTYDASFGFNHFSIVRVGN